MRKALLIFLALITITPQITTAATDRVYEKWLIKQEEDLSDWNVTGIEEGTMTAEGAVFNVAEQVVFYRPLPEGFHEHVDAMRLHYNATGLDEVAVLLLTVDDAGDIKRRFRLVYPAENGVVTEYVPLSLYGNDIEGTNVFAINFRGNASDVAFEGVRFLQFSFLEKLSAMWISFWSGAAFEPHTINIVIGPAIVTDLTIIKEYADWHLRTLSANAYAYVVIAWGGVFILLYAIYLRTKKDLRQVQQWVWKRFLLLLFCVWLVWDARMGLQFLANVMHDHSTYISQPLENRTFRGRDRFYDFAKFVAPLVADRVGYELFLNDKWPYFGSMRYYTYPANPNAGDIAYDTFVVYDRYDVQVQDNRLVIDGTPFTKTGRVLGKFAEGAFVFREDSEESEDAGDAEDNPSDSSATSESFEHSSS